MHNLKLISKESTYNNNLFSPFGIRRTKEPKKKVGKKKKEEKKANDSVNISTAIGKPESYVRKWQNKEKYNDLRWSCEGGKVKNVRTLQKIRSLRI